MAATATPVAVLRPVVACRHFQSEVDAEVASSWGGSRRVPLALAPVLGAAAGAAARAAPRLRGRRHGGRGGARGARTARASAVATAVAAAAQLAKAAAAAASGAGAVAGVKEAVDAAPPPRHRSGRRPKVVILGSGWGAATFLKGLSEKEAQMYDITVVSPRNFFLYTPLLPACTMGSIEERSILTPVRKLVAGKGEYLEAKCDHIDTVRKVVCCGRAGRPAQRADDSHERFPEGPADGKVSFELEYDILVYAVGAQTNDFNCPGVLEHASFFKEAPDARRVRERISDAFERASLPTASEEEKQALLSFVVVGGGPTGVEVAADLADFVSGDAAELYPKLVDIVKIRLINTGDMLLSTYDAEISRASVEVFQSKGVQVMSGYRVVEITQSEVKMRSRDGDIIGLEYGCVVWAAGIKEHALTTQLKGSLIELNEDVSELNVTSLKAPARGIITDEWLHVRGSCGSIFALGDAATVRHDRTLPFAEQLFKAADIEGTGELDLAALRDLFRGASDEFPQLEEYAQYLSSVVTDTNDDPRMAAIARVIEQGLFREQRAFKEAFALTNQLVGDRTKRVGYETVAADLAEADANSNERIDLEEFKALLDRVDKNLQAFPPTAQVAAQQGKYLAKAFAKGIIDGSMEGYKETTTVTERFAYFHKGALAYLGDGSAAFDLPVLGPVTGPAAGLAWKLYETSAQLSWKNRALVGLDWVRAQLFGRDTSRI